MRPRREFPDQPVVGVGGVVILGGRAVLVRRGSEPLKGEWSIPGGTLELGETLVAGVERELWEETGLRVRAVKLIEVFERIFPDAPPTHQQTRRGGLIPPSVRRGESHSPRRDSPRGALQSPSRPRYHFVIADYLCEALDPRPRPRPGSDVTRVALAREHELPDFNLTPTATRILKKAFRTARAREK